MPLDLVIPEPTHHARQVLSTLLEWDYREGGPLVSPEWLFEHASAALPVRFIEPAGHRYMERYFLGAHEGRIHYLHRFVHCDGDRSPHSHPFDATTRILHGEYTELRGQLLAPDRMTPLRECTRRAGDHSEIAAATIHQITSVALGTWTLFAHTPWTDQEWGFYTTPDAHGRTEYTPERDAGTNRNWWLKAPLGRDSRRLPFNLDPLRAAA